MDYVDELPKNCRRSVCSGNGIERGGRARVALELSYGLIRGDHAPVSTARQCYRTIRPVRPHERRPRIGRWMLRPLCGPGDVGGWMSRRRSVSARRSMDGLE